MRNTTLYLLVTGFFLATTIGSVLAQWDIPDGLGESPSSAYLYNENKDQVVDMDGYLHPEVKYVTDHAYPRIYLADTYVGFVLENVDEDTTTEDTVGLVKMTPVNPLLNVTPVAYEQGEGISNYFLPHCPQGATDVKGYKRVVYPDIYPGIDMHFYSNGAGPKIYFVIDPGADPDNLLLEFTGQDQLMVTAQVLQIEMAGMTLQLPNGMAYQVNAQNQVVPLGWTADYLDNGPGLLGFSLGSYDPTQTLVLQFGYELPTSSSSVATKNLGWCTYYGGQMASSNTDVALEQYGRNYFCGTTSEPKFPYSQGALFKKINRSGNLYILKFDSVTQVRKYATFYGGSKLEQDPVITISSQDEAHVAFRTQSTDIPFPVSQPTGAWVDTVPDGPNAGNFDLVIARFSSNGKQLIYTTYFGIGSDLKVYDLEINSKDEYYLLGSGPIGTHYLYKTGAHSSPTGHLFIQKWNPNHTVQWATRYKSSTSADFSALCFDANDNVFITGSDRDGLELKDPGGNAHFETGPTIPYRSPIFMIKLDSLDSLIWSTYFGRNVGSTPYDIASDGENVFITGQAPGTTGFPLKQPGPRAYFDTVIGSNPGSSNFDGFISEFSNDGELLWSTYLGGDGADHGTGIDVDDDGNVYVSGDIDDCRPSYAFPLQYNPDIFNLGVNKMGASPGGFLAAFNYERLRTWTTYFGGKHDDHITKVRTYGNDYLYLSGRTVSGRTKFPLEDLGGTAWYDDTKAINPRGHSATYAARFDISMFDTFVTVEEIRADNWKVIAYPNPTNLWLHIDLEGEANYQLLDISGRELQSGKVSPEQNALAVGWLSVGTYLLRLQQNSKVATVKFIKE